MKKPIRKALRCTRWALITAGSLGTWVAASAQNPPSLLPPVKAPASWAAGTPGSIQPACDNPHLGEIKVELAWMADPLTYPYQLEARSVGTVLEVRGEVLTQADREQALRLAREESGMRVVDRLQVNPSLTLPRSTKPANVLQRQAIASLGNELPQRAKDLSVSIWTNGQVLIKGTVPTYEEKLAVSRNLRRIGGCSCIINQLQVDEGAGGVTLARAVCQGEKPVQPEEPSAESVVQTSAVSILRPELLGSSSAVQTVAYQTRPAPAGPQTTVPEATSPGPISVQKTGSKSVIAYQTKWRRLNTVEVPVAEERSVNPPKDKTPASTVDHRTSTPSWKPAAGPTASLNVPVAGRSENVPAVPDRQIVTANLTASAAAPANSQQGPGAISQTTAVKNSMPTPQPLPGDWPAASAARPAYASAQTAYLAPAASAGAAGQATSAGVAFDPARPGNRISSIYVSKQTAAPIDDPVWTGKAVRSDAGSKRNDQAATTAPPKPQTSPYPDAYVATGVVILDPSVQQSSLPSAPAPKPQATSNSSGSYVASGVVTFDAPAPAPKVEPRVPVPAPRVERRAEANASPKATPSQIQLQTRIQQRIAAACGKPTEDVLVSITGERNVLVRVKAQNTQEGETLSAKILQLAELGPYEVALDIAVMP
jgi:hypothetical protein